MSDTLYKIAEDGIVQFVPTWTVTRAVNPGPLCPVTYEIFRMISSVETALTAYELAALTVVSYQSTGAPFDL